MFKLLTTTFTFAVLISTSTCVSQTCKDYAFPNGAAYASCVDLPAFDAFLHWNYTPSTSNADIAFRRPGTSSSQWIAWAINPSGGAMLGSQAVVAHLTSSGSVRSYTSSVDSYETELSEGTLSFEVPTVSGSYVNGEMTIFARMHLGSVVGSDATHVWMVGPLRRDGVPGEHLTLGSDVKPVKVLDFGSNGSGDSIGMILDEGSLQESRNVHGVLNAVSWGTLLPVGVMFARYLRVLKSAGKAWFYLHSACQTMAYVVGVAGWVTGHRLGGSDASANHGTIGLILFILGTLQVLALLARPKPNHRLRVYWNVYHYSCGYTAIILSIINVYKGLSLLDPLMIWKHIYTGILIFLGSIAILLEIITWVIVIRRNRASGSNLGYDDGGTT